MSAKPPTARERALLVRLLDTLDRHAPIAPDPRDVAHELGVPPQAVANVAKVGEREGLTVSGPGGLVYPRKTLERILLTLPGPELTVAEARDALGTTRRFADAILGCLETMGRLERRGGTCRLLAVGEEKTDKPDVVVTFDDDFNDDDEE